MSSKTAVIIWGNQLTIEHHSALLAEPTAPVIMIESKGISKTYKFHKQKLAFVFSAMRDYADELKGNGRIVHYYKLEDSPIDWFESLKDACNEQGITQLVAMRACDRTPQQKLEAWCKQSGIELKITPNLQFLTSTSEFNEWAEQQKRLQMEQFYRWQRQRLNILMDGPKPVGGKWNYDSQNRKPLPKNHVVPALELPKQSSNRAEVSRLVQKEFADHPGEIEQLWLPTTRAQARLHLQDFIDHRFAQFGDYEDAMQTGETFLYHSGVSALLNVGLLHASEVVEAALAADVPLAAKEGFIRQIIGWREFMFGLYHYLPADWKDSNYLEQQGTLPDWWWQLKGAPEPPLEDVLGRLHTYGYSHHIERLMVLGNYMLLADYAPSQVYDWFMTMYVDAYEWVMVPNIIGMSQYADGGLDNGGFASKPYISGSNYLQKMGRWWPTTVAAKESDWTNLYWKFLERHRHKLANNFRLRPLLSRFKDK